MYKQFLPVAFAAVAFAAPQVPDLSALPACAQGIVLSALRLAEYPCRVEDGQALADYSLVALRPAEPDSL
jgi:hypothetical protein